MKFFEIGYLNSKQRSVLEEKGLFCYDLRLSDSGVEIATIEKHVLVNNVGHLITNEKILLGDKAINDFIDYKSFVEENEVVNSIEALFNNKKIKSKERDER